MPSKFKFGLHLRSTSSSSRATTATASESDQGAEVHPTPKILDAKAGPSKAQTVHDNPTKSKHFLGFRSARSKSMLHLELDRAIARETSRTKEASGTPRMPSLTSLFLHRTTQSVASVRRTSGTKVDITPGPGLTSAETPPLPSPSPSLESESDPEAFDINTFPDPSVSPSEAASVNRASSTSKRAFVSSGKPGFVMSGSPVVPPVGPAFVIQPPTPVLPSIHAALKTPPPPLYRDNRAVLETQSEVLEEPPHVQRQEENRPNSETSKEKDSLQQITEIFQRAARRLQADASSTQSIAFRSAAPIVAFLYVLAVGVLLPRNMSLLSQHLGDPSQHVKRVSMVVLVFLAGMAVTLSILRGVIWLLSKLGKSLCAVDLDEVFRKGTCIDAEGRRMGDAEMIVGNWIG